MLFIIVFHLPKIKLLTVDLSYGMYIYAWPIQQLLYFKGVHSPYILILFTILISAPLAFFSWVFIESPVMLARAKIKNYFCIKFNQVVL
mgnify:CR=1 FL=1